MSIKSAHSSCKKETHLAVRRTGDAIPGAVHGQRYDLISVYALTILVYLVAACASNNAATKTDIESIQFGSGGGFTGNVVAYTLTANGQLSKSENGSVHNIKAVDKKSLQLTLEQAVKLKSLHLNSPENVYSFIKIRTAESENSIVWGLGTANVDSAVTKLYGELMALTK